MIVSELAHEAGISSHAVRYYARIGLLNPCRNPDNGYKQFENDDIHRVQFIQQAKLLGFKLNEIEALLNEACEGKSICSHVRGMLSERIEQRKAEIRQLQNELSYMKGVLRHWEGISDAAPDRSVMCPLIESELA